MATVHQLTALLSVESLVLSGWRFQEVGAADLDATVGNWNNSISIPIVYLIMEHWQFHFDVSRFLVPYLTINGRRSVTRYHVTRYTFHHRKIGSEPYPNLLTQESKTLFATLNVSDHIDFSMFE